MSATMRNNIAVAVLVVVLLATGQSNADDEQFYESLPDVSIGKVFFSPQQREQLDQRRGSAPLAVSRGATTAGGSRRPSNDDAAGFIVSSKGTSKVYANGDFVDVRKRVTVNFPGSVKIVRSQDADEAEASDEAD